MRSAGGLWPSASATGRRPGRSRWRRSRRAYAASGPTIRPRAGWRPREAAITQGAGLRIHRARRAPGTRPYGGTQPRPCGTARIPTGRIGKAIPRFQPDGFHRISCRRPLPAAFGRARSKASAARAVARADRDASGSSRSAILLSAEKPWIRTRDRPGILNAMRYIGVPFLHAPGRRPRFEPMPPDDVSQAMRPADGPRG